MAPQEKRSGIFREKAMAKLASPEQIDKLLVVMTPKGWIALLTLFLLIIAALIWSFIGEIPITSTGKGIILAESGVFNVVSDQEGTVQEVSVRPGDTITKESRVARIGENEIPSSADGKILEVYIQKGDWVKKGDPIAWAHYKIEKDQELKCYAYFPVNQGEKITQGMDAKVGLESTDIGVWGYLLGKVSEVSDFPTTEKSMLNLIKNPGTIHLLRGELPAVIQTAIQLERNSKTPSGYQFTTKEGPPASKLQPGTICSVRVITETKRPIQYLFPSFSFSKKRDAK